MAALENDHNEVVVMLLDHQTDVNVTTNIGLTSLIFASDKGNREAVAMLLERAADVNAKTGNGWSSLMVAAHKRS